MNLEFDALVRERMDLLRTEHPDGDYPSGYAEHLGDECIECEALRRLEAEEMTA